MKTIAVLTDLTAKGEHAAFYALHLAQHLHANILLYNAFTVPSADPMAAQIAWPMEDFDELQNDTENELNLLVKKLEVELTASPAYAFKPVIDCRCHDGALNLHLDELLNNRDIVMLVIGSHKKGLSAWLMGNHMRSVIDNVTVPVLMVPENCSFKSIHKITFPTDLMPADIDLVHAVAHLAKPFGASLLLAHICPASEEAQIPVKKFLEEVTNKIDYAHIYYRNVCDADLHDGLNWLANQAAADLLVMVHRNKGWLDQLLNRSNTLKVAEQISIPLLVFPYPVPKLPVF
ncbi:universal stress protein [Mucilaginibacter robiniae]|uniref:Universal stress protein n=1 Tax=Mucilaginibacter robiniae TaxID=2728022 RepID=A0A7L5DZA4_9SPHI|nr:universal stress protein [Mucilaginibacter robiniae]QJD95548.1 universal stress protein [Mucilaginibacter robiniae]